MRHFKLRRGLNLPVRGSPSETIEEGPAVRTVAVLGEDYIDLKPRLAVSEGDVVGAGAPMMVHKDTPSVLVTSPVSGRVRAINRGARRKLVSIVVERDDEAAPPVDFSNVGDSATPEGVVERLTAAGLWPAFRARPYSKVPDPATRPAAIFVTAIDTEPLCADPAIVIQDGADAFVEGLKTVTVLTDGKTYLCHEKDAEIPGGDVDGVVAVAFSGPHPAGLAGTHMHFLEPPSATKVVWSIGYQDVIAIGRLMQTGHYDSARIIALCGPVTRNPRLLRTVTGASMEQLSAGELATNRPVRMISGSVLSGRAGEGPSAFMGRYARQLTLMEEDRDQLPLGWIRPMFSKFAIQPVLGSAFAKRLYALTTNLNGGRRAMVPIGTFEQLMPQDYLPTQLLRALLVMDTDQAQALGALELDEEDLGLVGFACPAKYEYALALRSCLTKIEKEG
ncbi:MAG: Na(+)-translocating NADH-quinone reductase subunit A [Pseudomonadota bacterium]